MEIRRDGEGNLVRQIEDVNGDGLLDLILQFRFGDTTIGCGDSEAALRGRTYDGQGIHGLDTIDLR